MAIALSYVGTSIVKVETLSGAWRHGQRQCTVVPSCKELYRKVYQIHQLGICNLDIHNGNVLVVGDSANPAEQSVVLFDFTSARTISLPLLKRTKGTMLSL
ncbi:hypothetical protein BDZ97DRAFT_1761137 [Flammula alnicola]|nr:hypothetical protein BDZ97DRAFT_1761137 [Flammula alnicola]